MKCRNTGYIGRFTGRKKKSPSVIRNYVCEECEVEFKAYRKVARFCSTKCKESSKDYHPGSGGKDKNHDRIAAALEAAGATTLDTSIMGGGFPDLLVGFNGVDFLLEIKNPDTQYGRSGLSDEQILYHSKWRGKRIQVVRNEEEALAAIGYVTHHTNQETK